MYKLLYIYKQAQFSAHIHLSNLINKVIISKQNDMQNCVKMWKLKTAFWVSYLGSTKTVSMENSGANSFPKERNGYYHYVKKAIMKSSSPFPIQLWALLNP